MKYLLIIIFLFFSAVLFSQKDYNISVPNKVEMTSAYFLNNSWKPFSGNLIKYDSIEKIVFKSKIVNGLDVRTEVFNENNELILIYDKGIEVEINKENSKSEFNKKNKFIEVSNVNVCQVFISYLEDPVSKEITKFNGVIYVDDDKSKIFYKNGIKIKIENYFDKDYKLIKESYEIFHSKIGNFLFDDYKTKYHGKYKIFDEKGNIDEKGKYKLGIKV
jgi:hypothetical protein